MCLQTKTVVSSHLHPAALYVYCRNTEDVSPVRVGDGVISHTDRQVQHPLLCLECEQILNKGGEAWVNPKLATVKDGFPLYDILMKGPAEAPDIYYAANNGPLETKTEKCRMFGLYVPGVLFTLNAGRLIDPLMREACFYGNSVHPIFVSDEVMGTIWNRLAKQYHESRKTRRYSAAQAKRSAARE